MESCYEHPTEEALERFLLNQSSQPEIELVETHILACDSCVARLETMETEIAGIKLALRDLEKSGGVRQAPGGKYFWKRWFTFPVLSWAGAAVVAMLAIAAFVPAQASFSANRGARISILPAWRPLDLHLNELHLADTPVAVQLVNEQGAELWKGQTTVSHDMAEVHLPRIHEGGQYFLRLYEPPTRGAEGGLLREFSFQVK